MGLCRAREDEDPMHALNRGYYVTSLLALAGLRLRSISCCKGAGGCSDAASGHGDLVPVRAHHPVLHGDAFPPGAVDREGITDGSATNIIRALAVGMETPALPAIVIWRGAAAELLLRRARTGRRRDSFNYAKGIYGTAIATMGMLSSAAYILAMDTFGPITDNAGGIIEMCNQPDADAREDGQAGCRGQHDQGADQGLCHRSASLAAFLLFSAYLERVA